MQEKENCCQEKNSSLVKIIGIIAFTLILSLVILRDTIFQEDPYYNSFEVVGVGKVPVSVDGALINFGVSTLKESTAEIAIEKTAQGIARVEEVLQNAGIEKNHRLLTGYVVNPLYKSTSTNLDSGIIFWGQENSIEGYSASQQITVFLSDTYENKGRIDEIVSLATRAGATQVGEVKMIAQNIEKLKDEARINALKDAKEKAQKMSQTAGIQLGKMTSWYENQISAPGEAIRTGYSEEQSSSQEIVPQGVLVLSPGQMEVVIELRVTFVEK